MRSRIFSSKYIKTISKGQIWIPAFIALGFLLAFPVTGMVKLSSWSDLQYSASQSQILYNNLWKDGFVLSGLIIASIAAFINSVNGFIYLYSGKKTDYYHGLPMKRAEMFLEKVFSGLVYYLIPYIVAEFLMICIGAARGFFSLNIMGMAVKMFFLHLIIYLVIYFSIVLVISVTGNMLMGILCLGGMYLYGIVLNLILVAYGQSFWQTFFSEYQYGGFNTLLHAASPGTLILSMVSDYAEGKAEKLLIAVIILGAVLGVLAWVAYKKRPSESAGKSMVYTWVSIVVRFMVVIPGGLAVGWIFYPLTTGKARILWWIFGMILGTVIIHGLLETIYQMSFQGFFAKKLQLVIAGVLVAVCALIFQKDLLHFDSYIPKQEDIASVNLNMMSFDQDYYENVQKTKDGKYEITDANNWAEPAMAFTGKNGIGDQTYKALQDIVACSPKSEVVDGNYSYYTSIKYTLKSGRVVYRKYWIETETLNSLVKGLYEEENLKEKKFGFLDLDQKYLNNIGLNDASGNGYSIFQNDADKMKQLLEAMKKDVDAATAEDFMQTPEVKIDFAYQLPGKQDVNSMIPGDKDEYGQYANWIIGIYPSFKNTLAILKETGYPLTVEDLDIKKIMLNYFNDENGQQEDVTYENPEEIEALKEALTVRYNGYVEKDSKIYQNIYVSVVTDKGEAVNAYGLKTEKLPDFVKEKITELGITQSSMQMDAPVTKEETVYTDDSEDMVSQEIIGGADEPTSIYLESSGDSGSSETE
mgnify:CR=1 FL=1